MAQIDELLSSILPLPPLQGLMEGKDETLGDQLYPPTCAPILNNLRVAGGKWSTRLGQTFFKVIPGMGDVRLLDNFYNDTGGRWRLAARGSGTGGILYDYEEGVDSAFQITTGGTGLGGTVEPYFQGFTLNNRFYFTDRFGALRRYEPAPVSGNQVRVIVQPAAPSIAPNAKARTFKMLEQWDGNAGVAPFGWTVSDNTKFDILSDTATNPPPGGGTSVKLDTLTNPVNATITENVAGEVANSNTIAFWALPGQPQTQIQFQVGAFAPDEITFPITANQKNQWTVFFVPIQSLATINFKRFIVAKNAGAADTTFSPLYLPGRLNGQYRYRYTHYNSSTGAESSPSPVSNGGQPLDLSVIGKDGQVATAGAFKKAATVDVTTDGDATTDKIRIYRNGGDAPSLIKDSLGRDVYFRVGTINDKVTTLTSSPAAAATSFTVASATGIAAGDCLVIEKGVVGKEEFVTVFSVVSLTITTNEKLLYSHLSGVSVQIAFLDNTANESIDQLALLDENRDAPPDGAKFIAISPDGRIWIFGYNGKKMGIAVSNRATPERTEDYEVFPNGVDPITRRSLWQGWRFEIAGDSTDEEIIWGGFFRGLPTVLTKRNLYVINALSQEEWSALAIQKVIAVGCIARDVVRDVNGVLYWVADGPRVVRWAGQGTSSMAMVPPENISHQRINVRLKAAPSSLWNKWFAVAHTQEAGRYYSLYYSPNEEPAPAPTVPLMMFRFEDAPGVFEDEGSKLYDLANEDICLA